MIAFVEFDVAAPDGERWAFNVARIEQVRPLPPYNYDPAGAPHRAELVFTDGSAIVVDHSYQQTMTDIRQALMRAANRDERAAHADRRPFAELRAAREAERAMQGGEAEAAAVNAAVVAMMAEGEGVP